MDLTGKNFDAAALGDAFEANRLVADSAEGLAAREDLADKGLQTVAADLGLDREQANALMAECLRACVGDREADLAVARQQHVPAWIAIGMAFGYLAHERVTQGEGIQVACHGVPDNWHEGDSEEIELGRQELEAVVINLWENGAGQAKLAELFTEALKVAATPEEET